MTNEYKKAYKEVIEIISHFPEEEYSKIPKEKIDFYKENMDKSYDFKINPEISLSEQNISNEASAIMVILFRDYFATDREKEKLKNILAKNQNIKEEEKREKYNPEDIFKNTRNNSVDEEKKNVQMVEYKENFFVKFKNWIRKLFKK